MSLFSSIILPQLEKELIAASPEISAFIIKQLGSIAMEVMHWVNEKSNDKSKIDRNHKEE
ncbi:MAG TPA: hypothetical protein VGJ00_10260 [Rhabdochlamydiaceae bacterium]|jgi:hypothetical protein